MWSKFATNAGKFRQKCPREHCSGIFPAFSRGPSDGVTWPTFVAHVFAPPAASRGSICCALFGMSGFRRVAAECRRHKASSTPVGFACACILTVITHAPPRSMTSKPPRNLGARPAMFAPSPVLLRTLQDEAGIQMSNSSAAPDRKVRPTGLHVADGSVSAFSGNSALAVGNMSD